MRGSRENEPLRRRYIIISYVRHFYFPPLPIVIGNNNNNNNRYTFVFFTFDARGRTRKTWATTGTYRSSRTNKQKKKNRRFIMIFFFFTRVLIFYRKICFYRVPFAPYRRYPERVDDPIET